MAEEEVAPAAAAAAADEEVTAAAEGQDAGETAAGADAAEDGAAKPTVEAKPLPPLPEKKVPKPDEDKFKADTKAIQDEVDEINAKLDKIREGLEANEQRKRKMGEGESVVQEKIRGVQEVIDVKVAELNALRGNLNKAKSNQDALVTAKKDKERKMPHKTLEDIDRAVKALEHKLSNTTLSLAEEKKLVADIAALNSSRKGVAELGQHSEAVAKSRDGKNELFQKIKDKSEELSSLREVLKKHRDERTAVRERNRPEAGKGAKDLLMERDRLRKLREERRQAKKEVADVYYGHVREYRKYEKAVNDHKYAKLRAQRDARRAEWQAREAERAAEEGELDQWAEEKITCQTLLTYLQRFVPKEDAASAVGGNSDEAPQHKDEAVAKRNNFDGMVALKRPDDDGPSLFASSSKKKKGRKGKSQVADSKGVLELKFSIETFQEFDLVEVKPPTGLDGVAATIDEIKARMAHYQTNPPKDAKKGKKGGDKAAAAESGDGEGGDPQRKSSQGKKGRQEILTTAESWPTLSGDETARNVPATPVGACWS